MAIGALLSAGVRVEAQVAVRGEVIYPVDADPIEDGVVVMEDGKITAIGPADTVSIPLGMKVLRAAVVTPGLVDGHSTVGLSGILNYAHDQDQLERSAPIQPQLRAIDAYNCRDELVQWVREFGITTIHTGHAPGELISGQTIVVKTYGATVEEALVKDLATIAATLGDDARKREKGKSPGTRGKMMAMLRNAFIEAGEYRNKLQNAEEDKKPGRDLQKEALLRVLDREVPLMVTAQRAQDIASAMRLAREFNLDIILDGGAESYMLLDQIKEAGIPVFLHPAMARAHGEMRNMSFETAAKLAAAGIPVAFQSGYESYVPKTRVLLFEAAVSAANGMTFAQALRSVTLTPAEILGVEERVGSLTVGKDGDVALYDGDPFEYTTHCIGVVGGGRVVSEVVR